MSRLTLNRETLRTLRGADLDRVRGAATGTCADPTSVYTGACPTTSLQCMDASLGGCTTLDRTVTRKQFTQDDAC